MTYIEYPNMQIKKKMSKLTDVSRDKYNFELHVDCNLTSVVMAANSN